jgi:hypothetical protein
MMVLCPTHHDEAKAMTDAEQRHLKANAHNIRNGMVLGLLKMRQDYTAIDLGGVELVGDDVGFTIDNEKTLSMRVDDDHVMQISARIYDMNDVLIAEIADNEWISGNPLAWDIEAGWQHVTIREKAGRINLEVNTAPIPTTVKARLVKNGLEIEIGQIGIRILDHTGQKRGAAGDSFKHMAFVNNQLALDSTTGVFRIIPIGGAGSLVGGATPRERLYNARTAYNRLRRDR